MRFDLRFLAAALLLVIVVLTIAVSPQSGIMLAVGGAAAVQFVITITLEAIGIYALLLAIQALRKYLKQ